MEDGLSGWGPDPFGLHQLRYFSADGTPTQLVSDDGLQSYDTVPAYPVTGTPSPGAMPHLQASDSGQTAWIPSTGPLDVQAVHEMHPLASVGVRPDAVLPQEDWWQAQDDRWYPPELHPSRLVSAPAAPPAAATSRTPRRRSLVVSGAAAALCLAVVIGVLVGTDGSGSNADAAVVRAVNSAIGDKTADLSLTSTTTLGGSSVTATGSGSADLTDDSLEATFVEMAGAQTETIHGIYLGATIYESLPQIAQAVPGKSWVSLDLSSLGSSLGTGNNQSAPGSNPLANLRALALQGNSVDELGPSTVDGKAVQGYGVTFSQSVLQSELRNAAAPAWLKTALSQVKVNGASTKVFVDGAGQLVREVTTASEAVGSVTVTVDETVDFSNYGTPVSIQAPAPDQVIPFSQFQSADHTAATN